MKAQQIVSGSLFTINHIVKQITLNNSWYTVLDTLLEEVIAIKLEHCKAFRSKLKDTKAFEIIYVSKDRYLGSGLTQQLTSLTKSKYFPGHNKLGKLLEEIRQTFTNTNT